MTIFISGAGSGIGYDAAIALAQRNHQVTAGVKSKDELEKFAGQKNITTVICDITSESDRKKIAKYPIDVLINNAGVGESGPIVHVPLEKIEQNYRVNVFGTVALIQQLAPRMIAQKSGRIINVSSVVGRITLPYLGVYSSTKHALEAISDALRQELQPYSIFVSVIEPGPIATGFNEKMVDTKNHWLGTSSVAEDEKNRMDKQHNKMLAKQYDTKSVVSAIIHAVESKRPKSRYIAPAVPYGFLIPLARLMPDFLRDRLFKIE